MYQPKFKTGVCSVCGNETTRTKYCIDCAKTKHEENIKTYFIRHPEMIAVQREREIIYRKNCSEETKNRKRVKDKERYEKNSERIKEKRRERHKRQYIPRRKKSIWTPEYTRKYRNEYYKKYYKDNPSKKIGLRFRQRLWRLVNGISVKYKMDELIGCTKEFLTEYLESQFKEGMTWANHGMRGWHIDHIIPCSKFDLTKEDELLKCFHYTNLQPLWSVENLRKYNK